MIDSDLVDSDLGTQRGVHLTERKKEERDKRSNETEKETMETRQGGGYPFSVNERREAKRQRG